MTTSSFLRTACVVLSMGFAVAQPALAQTSHDKTKARSAKHQQAAQVPAEPVLEDHEALARNALRRCQVFQTAADRSACEARVRQPQISGSVQDGGVVRKSTHSVPAPR